MNIFSGQNQQRVAKFIRAYRKSKAQLVSSHNQLMLWRFWKHQQSAGVFSYHCFSLLYHHLDCEVKAQLGVRTKPGLTAAYLSYNDDDDDESS
jgi:hypothetical protein